MRKLAWCSLTRVPNCWFSAALLQFLAELGVFGLDLVELALEGRQGLVELGLHVVDFLLSGDHI